VNCASTAKKASNRVGRKEGVFFFFFWCKGDYKSLTLVKKDLFFIIPVNKKYSDVQKAGRDTNTVCYGVVGHFKPKFNL
jgi:hypothetical protein